MPGLAVLQLKDTDTALPEAAKVDRLEIPGMTAQSHRLLSDALQFPERDRSELASLIIASLDGPPDPDAEGAWAEEIARRVQKFEKAPSRAEDWSVVKARLKQNLWPKSDR